MPDANNLKFTTQQLKKLEIWSGDDEMELSDVFPHDYKVLENKFNYWLEQLDELNIDAYRIGLLNSKESREAFDSLFTCCGSSEEKIVIDGKTYMFGCNYGH